MERLERAFRRVEHSPAEGRYRKEKKGEVSMLGITHWTPWTELACLHRDLDAIYGRVFGEAGPRQTVDSVKSFPPAVDVKREGDRWMVSIAVPGLSPDQLNIAIVGRTLRVRGERSSEEKTGSVMSDIAYGWFERDFTLPEDIDTQHVQATYRDGMLELVLPLTESAKPHRIEIKVAPETKQLHAA
jgi:HSP20 family protein